MEIGSVPHGIGRVHGKLVFETNQDAIHKKIELYARGRFLGSEEYLGDAISDTEGNFSISYKCPNDLSSRLWHSQLTIKIVEQHAIHDNLREIFNKTVILQTINLNVPASNAIHDVGTIQVSYYPIPKDLDQENPPPSTLMQTAFYNLNLARAALPVILPAALSGISGNFFSPARIQSFYDRLSSFPRSEPRLENLIEELKNTICAIDYLQTETTVTWTANWDQYQFDQDDAGNLISLPNVTVVATKNQSSKVQFQSMTIQFRNQEAVTITEEDKPEDIRNAIFIARSVFCIAGESKTHLAEGHLLPGIAAENFFKYFSTDHPLFEVLRPFLAGLPSINYLGSQGVIFGNGSVLAAAALSLPSITQVIIDGIKAKANLLEETYPEPVDETHFRAIHAKGFYQLYKEFLLEFMTEKMEELNQPAPLKEIVEWSEGMTARLPLLPLIIKEGEDFTNSDNREKLAIFLAHILNQVTFLHWSVHSRQQLLTHGDQASIGMRVQNFTKGMTLDPFGGTSSKHLNSQLRIARLLLNFPDTLFLSSQSQILPNLYGRVRQYTEDHPNDYNWAEMSLGTNI